LPSKHTKFVPIVPVMDLPPKHVDNKRFKNMSTF